MVEVVLCSTGDALSADHQANWQEAYQAALLEVDPAKLPERIERAYQAIQKHIALEIQKDGAGCQALSDALANLRVLRREAGLPAHDPNRKKPDSPAPEQ